MDSLQSTAIKHLMALGNSRKGWGGGILITVKEGSIAREFLFLCIYVHTCCFVKSMIFVALPLKEVQKWVLCFSGIAYSVTGVHES